MSFRCLVTGTEIGRIPNIGLDEIDHNCKIRKYSIKLIMSISWCHSGIVSFIGLFSGIITLGWGKQKHLTAAQKQI